MSVLMAFQIWLLILMLLAEAPKYELGNAKHPTAYGRPFAVSGVKHYDNAYNRIDRHICISHHGKL